MALYPAPPPTVLAVLSKKTIEVVWQKQGASVLTSSLVSTMTLVEKGQMEKADEKKRDNTFGTLTPSPQLDLWGAPPMLMCRLRMVMINPLLPFLQTRIVAVNGGKRLVGQLTKVDNETGG